MGIGMALHEETLTDHSLGRIVNHNLAEYHMPVHADIPELEVIFVEEQDDKANPIGVKGLGEIGIPLREVRIIPDVAETIIGSALSMCAFGDIRFQPKR